MPPTKTTSVNSKAEELFVELFCEAFGPAKANLLYIQHSFVDIYGNHRYIDFALENHQMKTAIEIDGKTYHNPKKISDNKYYDDLLKQNSLVYEQWAVYRWAYNQLLKQPEKVKDELTTLNADDEGKVKVADIVESVKSFYEWRKEKGLVAEKSNSIYQKGGYTDKDVEKNIFSNPFKRFADMRFFIRCKDVAYIEVNSNKNVKINNIENL